MPVPSRALLAAAALLLLAPLFAGCGESAPPRYRSGFANDDDVEGPLLEEVKGYENALRVSNTVLEMLKNGDAKGVYEQYFDPRLRQKYTLEQMVAPIEFYAKRFGPIQRYKPMQWGFARGNSEGMKILYSTKIVEHERGEVRYHFHFEDDGQYTKLVGIGANPRRGVAPPGPP